MKTNLGLALLLLLIAGNAVAQIPDQTSAPGIIVIDHDWRKHLYNPALDEDPFRPNDEQAQFTRDGKVTERMNDMRIRGGETPVATVRRTKPADASSPGSETLFIYRLKIKNTGIKTIRSIEWEYKFYDKETKQEVGRRRQTTNIKLGPGKVGQLTGISNSPPSNVVSAESAGKSSKDQYIERITINRIEYQAGAAWQRPIE